MENPSNMIPSTIISVGSNLMGNVPTPEAADQGNVLTAGANGSYDWDPIPSTNEVPDVSGDDSGKVLTADGSSYGWQNLPSADEVPDVTSGDNGKVLMASYTPAQNEDPAVAEYSWESLPATSEVPEVTSSDNGKVLMASYTPAAGDDPAVAEYSWESIPSQIPAFDPVEDAGKVLAIKSDGSGLEWISLT